MPRHLEPGDRVDLHYLVGVVTSITKSSGIAGTRGTLALALPCFPLPPIAHWRMPPSCFDRSQPPHVSNLRPGLALPLARVLAIAPLAARPTRGQARPSFRPRARIIDRHIKEIGGPRSHPGADLDACDRHRLHAGGRALRQARGVSRQAEQVPAADVAAGHRRHRGGLRRNRRLVALAADRADPPRGQAARAAKVRRRLLRGLESRRSLRVDHDGRKDDVRGAPGLQDSGS